MPRLLYLASELGPEAFRGMARDLQKAFPNHDLYSAVAEVGVNAAGIQLRVGRPQLRRLVKLGASGGPARLEEWRLLVADEIMDEDPKLSVLGSLDRWVSRKEDDLVPFERTSLADVGEGKIIPKFPTGFQPLDLALQYGVYQGVLVVMALPGVGKTSLMISIMEGIMKTHPTWESLFFEMEIPMDLMKARISPVLSRVKFKETDHLFCGSLGIDEIEKQLRELPPNQDRVLFIDGPDAMPSGGGDGRRLELGHIYRRLVYLKNQVRLVVVSSQPNRSGREGDPLKLSSMAESWEKAWYADMVVGVNSVGVEKLRLKVLKNRFGMKGGEATFLYNLEDLSWEDGSLEDDW